MSRNNLFVQYAENYELNITHLPGLSTLKYRVFYVLPFGGGADVETCQICQPPAMCAGRNENRHPDQAAVNCKGERK